jgi:hypothetical protein
MRLWDALRYYGIDETPKAILQVPIDNMISQNVRHEMLTLASYYGGIRQCVSILRGQFEKQAVQEQYIHDLYAVELRLGETLYRLQQEAYDIQRQIDSSENAEEILELISIAKRVYAENRTNWSILLEKALDIIYRVAEQSEIVKSDKYREVTGILGNFKEMTVAEWI